MAHLGGADGGERLCAGAGPRLKLRRYLDTANLASLAAHLPESPAVQCTRLKTIDLWLVTGEGEGAQEEIVNDGLPNSMNGRSLWVTPSRSMDGFAGCTYLVDIYINSQRAYWFYVGGEKLSNGKEVLGQTRPGVVP
ncbi:hypothetical protein R3P38DRAFT_2793560 [Favolaschia claudopus]|uniref:Uncharacterized protein n=1 Tax=Favolaschia claudopus TaxID=2862362 RepID=A0AAW0ACZ9_9AGAR